MGIRLFGNSCSSLEPTVIERIVPDPRNPDPRRFEIMSYHEQGNYLLVQILYPNCTNYEGQKILLFKGVTFEELKTQNAIDPHFSDSSEYIHPIARFVPTSEGWEMGLKLM